MYIYMYIHIYSLPAGHSRAATSGLSPPLTVHMNDGNPAASIGNGASSFRLTYTWCGVRGQLVPVAARKLTNVYRKTTYT